MDLNYGELVVIHHALKKLKGKKTELIFSNKNGLVNYEPVRITELMEKVKGYGENLENNLE